MEAVNFSIIIPTYKEANNLKPLITRVAPLAQLAKEFEVIIVDDNSHDGIDEVIEVLRPVYPWLKFIMRRTKRSLSQSVIDGLAAARYPFIIIMDADLSHPPEIIPLMLAELTSHRAEMVIGSRYISGGSTAQAWPAKRRFFSKISALLTKKCLGVHLHDPLSGFIGISKEKCFSGAELNPIGWKISLELLIKCHCKKVTEIPIHFSERKYGSSKMNWKVIIHFCQHLLQLRRYQKRSLVR